MKNLSNVSLILFSMIQLNSLLGQEWQCGDTLIDIRDGQTYQTVQIFDNCWMADNLNIGELVHKDSSISNNEIIEKFCFYNREDSCNHYGGLYDWNEAMNYSTENAAQGICPEGWHIMTSNEFLSMRDSLGGGAYAGGKLKATGFRYWGPPNTGATNESGFTGIGSGNIDVDNSFTGIRGLSSYWTSTRYVLNNEYMLSPYELSYNSAAITYYGYDYNFIIQMRFSIRCVKDKNLSIGENVLQNDLKIQPNPFKIKTEIIFKEKTEVQSLKLTDISGKVYYPEFRSINNKIVLYRGNLTSGTYTLLIKTKQNDMLSAKIVIK